MAFALYSEVILTRDVADEGLRAGDVGTIVERHAAPGGDEGYSIEFFDMLSPWRPCRPALCVSRRRRIAPRCAPSARRNATSQHSSSVVGS
jgi:hypothetical protein